LQKWVSGSTIKESQEEQLLRMASLNFFQDLPKLLPPDQVRTCVGMCLKID